MKAVRFSMDGMDGMETDRGADVHLGVDRAGGMIQWTWKEKGKAEVSRLSPVAACNRVRSLQTLSTQEVTFHSAQFDTGLDSPRWAICCDHKVAFMTLACN